jgi:nitrogen fixation NifU-like protein
MCGDRVQVFVRRAGDGSIAETGFEARGCAISVASADLMAEAVAGATPEQARALFGQFREMATTGRCEHDDPRLEALQPLSGVHEFPSRVKCATLPWHALAAALEGGKEATSE